MEGRNHRGHLLVLTERISKMLMIKFLPRDKNAKGVAEQMTASLLAYKSQTLSITVDNGTEFAEHKLVSMALNCEIYFTYPYSSWEKGQVEKHE